MEIRNPLPEEKKNIIALWKYCFNKDSETFINHYFSNVYAEENTWVTLENDEPTASLQLNPYHFSYMGNMTETKYVVGMSSLPENRGSGGVTELFNFSFHNLYVQHIPFVFLMAIDYGLYRPFGFSHIFDKHIIKGKTKSLYQKTSKKLTFVSLSKESQKTAIHKLADFYNTSLNEKYLAFANRDYVAFKNNLKELYSDNGYAYLAMENEMITGYLFYYFEENKIIIKELLYNDTEVLKEILKFIYNHNTQFENFEIRNDHPEIINQFLPNPRENQNEMIPFLMAKIINLESFMIFFSLNNYFSDDYKLKVIDEQITENNGIYLLNHSKDISKLQNNAFDFDLEIDSTLLTQLVFGYITGKEALYFTDKFNASCNDKKRLFFDMFKEKQSFFFNEYV